MPCGETAAPGRRAAQTSQGTWASVDQGTVSELTNKIGQQLPRLRGAGCRPPRRSRASIGQKAAEHSLKLRLPQTA